VGTTLATTYADTAIVAATTYGYTLIAVDEPGNLSQVSVIVYASVSSGGDTIAPTAPSGLATSVVSSTQMNLSWTASTDAVGVTGYRVERCLTASCTYAQIATPTATTYNNTGLTASTGYSYRVRATDAAGNLSTYSTVASATTQAAPDTIAPTAPSGLTTSVVSSTQINLSWTASTDAIGVTSYKVQRCVTASCTFALIATTTATTYNNTGLTASTGYSYRVRATDAAGNLSTFSTVASATTQAAPDTIAPTVPSGLTTSVISSTQINLSWTASTDTVGVTGYKLERCLTASCTYAEIATPTATTYNNTGLTASIGYSYRVRATDAAGNLSTYSTVASATTQAAPDTIAPTVPSGLTTSVISGTQINLSWTASTDTVGVTGYKLERCLTASCTYVEIATPTATTYNNTGLTASTGYSYRVRAGDAAGNLSTYSQIAVAITQSPPPVNFSYRYDSQGRLIQSTGTDGSQVTYEYDDNGNMKTINRQ
jgi:YD repeat-containing protein